MKMLFDICTCGCTSDTKESKTSKYCFPKKLLVAISVVVIIAMCVMPAEARAVEHRRRHQRRQPENMALKLTKETSGSMKRPKNTKTDLYKNATRKIMRQLRNTKRHFSQDRRVLNETRENGFGNPSWLPKVNFVDIHEHNYNSQHNVGSTILERRFNYLVPKLYKSLMEYKVILKLMQNVTIHYQDDKFYDYMRTRQDLIQKTLNRLYPFLTEITDNMVAVKMTIPPFDKSQMNLDTFHMKVDGSECLRQDYIAFRGYGNLLNNWNSEFKCPGGRTHGGSNKKCRDYEAQLRKKKGTRRPRVGMRI